MPRWCLGALVRIFFTTPSVNSPVRWSFFKMILTNIPGLIFALMVPSMFVVLCGKLFCFQVLAMSPFLALVRLARDTAFFISYGSIPIFQLHIICHFINSLFPCIIKTSRVMKIANRTFWKMPRSCAGVIVYRRKLLLNQYPCSAFLCIKGRFKYLVKLSPLPVRMGNSIWQLIQCISLLLCFQPFYYFISY